MIKMDISLSSFVDQQINIMKKALAISLSLQKKLYVLEAEKNELKEQVSSITSELERNKKEKCLNCTVLTEQLSNAKKEMVQMKKQEKTKLLKTIVKSLQSLEDGNTNAHHLFTQLCGGLDESGDSLERQLGRNVTILQDQDSDENTLQDLDSRVLVNDTMVDIENEESNRHKVCLSPPILVPETETLKIVRQKVDIEPRQLQHLNLQLEKRAATFSNENENILSSGDEFEILPQNKKVKTSPVLSTSTRQKTPEASNSGRLPFKIDLDETTKPQSSPMRSPSVLSEIVEIAENSRSDSSVWKMKPSAVVDASTNAAGGKKLKQMTLNLTKLERRQDISLSEGFYGGVSNTRQSDEERDLVPPSPQPDRKNSKKMKICETMGDPDLTTFNPGVTSTCSTSVENSFDRLPEVKKSPPFKYRRDTVRKRDERKKLPGQDCDQCAKYYQAAGVREGEARARLNTCSRHRDKFQVRANTPPGFWDPVLPDSE